MNLFLVLLRQRRTVLAFAFALPLIAISRSLLSAPKFTTSASFLPQQRRVSGSNLSGLAAQFGVALPGADPSQSPNFYADIIKTRQMLGNVVDATYDVTTDSGPAHGNLTAYFGLTKGRSDERREDAIIHLGKSIVVTPQAKTGVVKFSVTSDSRALAREIAIRLISELNRFNLATRSSQATEERKFTEKRLADAKTELTNSEDLLRYFLQANRTYIGAPTLQLQQERLQRDVTLRQQIYSTLAQAYEQARIEEVRDTPVISVVEQPYRPVRRDPRGTVTKAAVAFVAGVALGILVGLVKDRLRTTDGALDEAELVRLTAAVISELRAPWRLLLPAKETRPHRIT